MEQRQDEYARLAAMLKSVDDEIDYPNDKRSKAQVVRAAIGSIDVKDERAMRAICKCGWRGTMLDCRREHYDSGAESWRNRAGRAGYHWHCPKCEAVIWRYYYMIS